MRPMMEVYPRVAPWVTGILTTLFALLFIWIRRGGVTLSDVPGAVAGGVGSGVAVFLMIRRDRKRSE
jgi:hypothetical protein